MDGWMDGQMDEWMDGWMNGWMDRWMNGWYYNFNCQNFIKEVLKSKLMSKAVDNDYHDYECLCKDIYIMLHLVKSTFIVI